jgi:transcription antitermination factor NusG
MSMHSPAVELDFAGLAPEEAVPDGLSGDWWVAHTRARNEKALSVDLSRMGIVHYLPLYRRMSRSPRSGRTSWSSVPVFTGYLFFNGTQQQRYRVLRTNRVAQTLYVYEQDELVSQLRHVHQVLVTETAFEHLFGVQVGQWVQVTGGALAGVEGCVVRKLGRTRLAINVYTLGQSVLVEVDGNLLEVIDAPAPAACRAS